MVNSNGPAWNICTEGGPGTDRARAEAGGGLGRDEAAVRGKTVSRVASEATSRTEAGNGKGRGRPPPEAGGNLEMSGCDYWS